MAEYTGTFETGVAGNTIATGDAGAATAWDSINLVGTLQYSSVEKYGALSARQVSDGSGQASYLAWGSGTLGASLTTHYGRLYMFLPAGHADYFYPVRGFDGGNRAFEILIWTDQKVHIRDQAGNDVGTGSVAFSTGQWVRMEWKVVSSATAGVIECKVFNDAASGTPSETITSTGSFSTRTKTDLLRFLFADGHAAVSSTYYFDNIVVNDTGYPGPFVPTLYGAAVLPLTTGFTASGRNTVQRGASVLPVTVSVTSSGRDTTQRGAVALPLAFAAQSNGTPDVQAGYSHGLYGSSLYGTGGTTGDANKTGADTGTGSETSLRDTHPAAVEPVPPRPLIAFSWTTDPLNSAPVWVDAESYLRTYSTNRGRSYEYDRMEAGRTSYTLDNRDRRFDPTNASSPYYPDVQPTRRVKLEATASGTVYPVIQAFTEGFPQQYPGEGMDAIVQQSASDWFYPLNVQKFAGGTTTLAAQVSSETETTLSLTSTALPLPQAYPFVIQVGTSPDVERMNVTGSPGAGQWTVERGYGDTVTRIFAAGATVRSEAVRFGQEPSGTRINNCLDFLGVETTDRDIDAGNSTIAESEDLVGTRILEHLLLIAECENGRFFIARDGTVTFRERHWQFLQELTARATFGDGEDIPYLAEGVVLAHDDAKLYNRIRITITDGTVIEVYDQASIDDHLERTLEKQWPLASALEAYDAAAWMLTRLKRAQLRLPALTTVLRDTFSPYVLQAEIAQRYHAVIDPPIAGGDVIDSDVIIEGISHSVRPGRWAVTFELSQPDPVNYWRVGVVGASEIGETTIPAY